VQWIWVLLRAKATEATVNPLYTSFLLHTHS